MAIYVGICNFIGAALLFAGLETSGHFEAMPAFLITVGIMVMSFAKSWGD